MKIKKLYGVESVADAEGCVVVIDVFRAASFAAYMLGAGAKEIIPVATAEESFAYKKNHPAYILAGEDHGTKIPGFDLGNSPFELQSIDVVGKTVVHRSTQGTQGLVRATLATQLLFGSFVTASAIVKYIHTVTPAIVSLVALDYEHSEDDAFAMYIEQALRGAIPDMNEILKQLEGNPHSAWFFDSAKPQFPEEDFYLCLKTDRFPFVVKAEREPYLHLVKA